MYLSGKGVSSIVFNHLEKHFTVYQMLSCKGKLLIFLNTEMKFFCENKNKRKYLNITFKKFDFRKKKQGAKGLKT